MKKRLQSRDWDGGKQTLTQDGELERELSKAVNQSISDLAEKLKAVIQKRKHTAAGMATVGPRVGDTIMIAKPIKSLWGGARKVLVTAVFHLVSSGRQRKP